MKITNPVIFLSGGALSRVRGKKRLETLQERKANSAIVDQSNNSATAVSQLPKNQSGSNITLTAIDSVDPPSAWLQQDNNGSDVDDSSEYCSDSEFTFILNPGYKIK